MSDNQKAMPAIDHSIQDNIDLSRMIKDVSEVYDSAISDILSKSIPKHTVTKDEINNVLYPDDVVNAVNELLSTKVNDINSRIRSYRRGL